MKANYILVAFLLLILEDDVNDARHPFNRNITLIIGRKIFRNPEAELNDEFGKYKRVLQDYYNRNSPSAFKVKLIEIISGSTENDGPFGGIPVDEIYTRWAHTKCMKTDSRDPDQCAVDQNVFKHWVCKHEIDKSGKNPMAVRSDCGWRIKMEHLQNHVIDHKISLTGNIDAGGETRVYLPVAPPPGQQPMGNDPNGMGNAAGHQINLQQTWQRSDSDDVKTTGASSVTVQNTHGMRDKGDNKHNDTQE